MDMLRCDSCGKPLGEGAVGRAEAVRRDPDLIVCSSCLEMERRKHALPIAAPPESLAKWKRARQAQSERNPATTPPADSQSCIIELSDGRTLGGKIVLHPNTRLEPGPQGQAKRTVPVPRRAMSRKAKSLHTDSRAMPLSSHATRTRSPHTMPVLLLMLIVLPAFAISLVLALMSQSENNELRRRLAEADVAHANAPDPARAHTQGRPLTGNSPPNSPTGEASLPGAIAEPDSSALPSVLVLPVEVRERLRVMEQEIAAPVVARLGSSDRGTRLLALADAIRLRALAAAPAIRNLLASDDPAERQLAASTLGELRDMQARETLADMAEHDPVPEVQLAARRALNCLNGETLDLDLAGLSNEELRMLERAFDASSQPQALRIVRGVLEEREGRKRG